MRKLSMREAVNEALHIAFNSDERIFTAGEDIAVYGGQLRCSYDLLKNFGEKRDLGSSDRGTGGRGFNDRAAPNCGAIIYRFYWRGI